ncbi:MAG: hypothetical protein R3F14_44675 [Polyangiaceae bacterium]
MDAMSTLVRRQILEGAPPGTCALSTIACEKRRTRGWPGGPASKAPGRRGSDRGAPRGVPNESEYAPLANHHAAAGHHDAAHWYATLAAAQAESLYANEQAIELRRVALRAAAEGAQRP